MEQTMVPEIQVSEPSTNPDAAALALTGNTMQDLQSVARELGVQVDASGNVVESSEAQPAPVTPEPKAKALEQPQAAPKTDTTQEATPEAPKKFLNPDGSVNEEKLSKSSAALDEQIAKYRAKEREFHQVQNKVNNQAQQQVPTAVPLSPLEIQMANDILAEAASQGLQLDQRFAIAQARVMARGLEAKHAAELNATQDLRQRVEDNERRRELQGLIDDDPQLMSPEMIDTLWKIRQERPWINQSPTPWTDAYYHFRGTQGRTGQVKTPNPTGTTAKAPPTPVGPVSRVQPSANTDNPKSLSDDQLLAEIKKIYPNFRGK